MTIRSTGLHYRKHTVRRWKAMSIFGFQGSIIPVLITIVLGLAGLKLAVLARLPVPALIGPMILVALAMLVGVPRVDMPLWLLVTSQSIIGGFIGRRVDRSTLKSASSMIPAMFVTAAWYVAGTALVGWGVAGLARQDLTSAFLATAPGGVAEMTALAITAKADVAFVATLQTLRVIAANVLIPLLAKLTPPAPPQRGASVETHVQAVTGGETGREAHWTLGLAASLAGGVALTMFNFPAGGVVGSLLVIAGLRLAGICFKTVPKAVQNFAYITLGISVGGSFDSGTIIRLGSSLWILAAATTATLASGLALGAVVRKLMHLDYRTAMLACSPGGLSLMAVVAEETGAQSVLVSLFHLVRIVWVILAMPVFIRLVG